MNTDELMKAALFAGIGAIFHDRRVTFRTLSASVFEVTLAGRNPGEANEKYHISFNPEPGYPG